MNKKTAVITAYLCAGAMLLTSCNYKPPYDRGYEEGYEAGFTAAGGDASQMPAPEPGTDTPESHERSAISDMMSSKPDEAPEEGAADTAAGQSGAEDISEGGEVTVTTVDETPSEEAAPETAGAAAENTEAEQTQDSEVLGNGSEPAENSGGGGGSVIPEGRIIAAEAVNEALYSHPEVIDGLRQIYTDTAIFGEYVGDSETNLLHKVNGPHFAELGYNTIVVFDDSKSMQDILNEGFYSKCSCCD